MWGHAHACSSLGDVSSSAGLWGAPRGAAIRIRSPASATALQRGAGRLWLPWMLSAAQGVLWGCGDGLAKGSPARRCRVPGRLLLPARPGHSTLELGDGGTWPWLPSTPRPVLGGQGRHRVLCWQCPRSPPCSQPRASWTQVVGGVVQAVGELWKLLGCSGSNFTFLLFLSLLPFSFPLPYRCRALTSQ